MYITYYMDVIGVYRMHINQGDTSDLIPTYLTECFWIVPGTVTC